MNNLLNASESRRGQNTTFPFSPKKRNENRHREGYFQEYFQHPEVKAKEKEREKLRNLSRKGTRNTYFRLRREKEKAIKWAENYLKEGAKSLNRKATRWVRKNNNQDALYQVLRKIREQQFINTLAGRSDIIIPINPYWKGKDGREGKDPIQKIRVVEQNNKFFTEKWHKDNKNQRKDVFKILESGNNYGILLGHEKSYQDYILIVIDIDCGGLAKIPFLNGLSYVVTGNGIHIYCLIKKATWEKANLFLGITGSDGLVIKVGDLRLGGVNSSCYVVGVGSTHQTGKKYELRNIWADFFFKGETIEDILELLGKFEIRLISQAEILKAHQIRQKKALEILKSAKLEPKLVKLAEKEPKTAKISQIQPILPKIPAKSIPLFSCQVGEQKQEQISILGKERFVSRKNEWFAIKYQDKDGKTDQFLVKSRWGIVGSLVVGATLVISLCRGLKYWFFRKNRKEKIENGKNGG